MPELDVSAPVARAAVAAFYADVSRAPGIAQAIRAQGLTGRQLAAIILRDVARGVAGAPGPALFPQTRAFWQAEINVKEARLRAGMGQWDALGSLFTSIGNAYTTKITTSAQTQIAKVQAGTEQKALDLQALNLRAQAAASQGFPGAAGGAPEAAGGLPGWVLPVGIGVLALGGLAIFLARRNPLPVRRRRVA